MLNYAMRNMSDESKAIRLKQKVPIQHSITEFRWPESHRHGNNGFVHRKWTLYSKASPFIIKLNLHLKYRSEPNHQLKMKKDTHTHTHERNVMQFHLFFNICLLVVAPIASWIRWLILFSIRMNSIFGRAYQNIVVFHRA